jgi:hypothetical protein
LYLDITLKPHDHKYKDIVVGAISSEVRGNTLTAAKNVLTGAIPDKKNEAVQENKAPIDEDDDYPDNHSANDDRSDSMNPNNDSYQASMDNHSDQMNPNNDAYWSSRGR